MPSRHQSAHVGVPHRAIGRTGPKHSPRPEPGARLRLERRRWPVARARRPAVHQIVSRTRHSTCVLYISQPQLSRARANSFADALRWNPLPLPGEECTPHDFVDGLVSLAGAGSAENKEAKSLSSPPLFFPLFFPFFVPALFPPVCMSQIPHEPETVHAYD